MLIGAVLSGCGDKTPPAPASNLPAPTFGTASISGHIRFLGTPPELKVIDTSKCHAGAKPVLEETIVVGANQGLKDVIVYIKDAPASDGSNQPMLELDQVDCVYTPHVLPIQVSQKMKIKNSDPTFHNSHWVTEKNGDANIGIVAGAPSQVVNFTQPEFLRIRCDVHPWMESWVGVMNHPFFATTARDGSFIIEKLPPGTYTLATWHPLLGEREQAIVVTDTGASPVTIDYAPPAK
jgi:hypothetical protein